MLRYDSCETIKERYDHIYSLVKQQNRDELNELVRRGVCLDPYYGKCTLIGQLAMEGDSASVDFIIKEYSGNRNAALLGYAKMGYVGLVDKLVLKEEDLTDVVCGYAFHGDRERVNAYLKGGARMEAALCGYALRGFYHEVNLLIEKGANSSNAICCYALGGFVDQVNELIVKGGNIDLAVLGYAQTGYSKEVTALIQQGAKRDHAISGYAKGGFVDRVNELIKQGASRTSALGGYAKGGHVEEVDALISQGVDHNYAVWGYAYAGLFGQVNALIAKGASRDYAVEGYALGGFIDQVDDLIKQGASRDVAVCAYAITGDVKQVDALLLQGASRVTALIGYACGGNINQVNNMIATGVKHAFAVAGYELGGYLNQRQILRLLVSTNDLSLRKSLAEKASKENPLLNAEALQTSAARIQEIKNKYQLDFYQSRSLTIKGVRVWLLQGSQLVRNRVFPAEIYLHISALVMNLSRQDVEIVFKAIHQKLFSDSNNLIDAYSTFRLFDTPAEYLEARNQVKERFKLRSNYYTRSW